jgi:hypothetical protein
MPKVNCHYLFSDAAGLCCFSSSPSPAMVVRIGSGRLRLPAGLEEFGEILWIMSSSKLEAILPRLFHAGMAAKIQPPMRRPSTFLLRKLDGTLPPSGLVPGGLVTDVGRRITPEGSQRAARSRSSAATPGGRRRPVAEAPRSLIA